MFLLFHVFAASTLTDSNTKLMNLTWLPLETMHHSHTWHDYTHDLDIIIV